MESFISFQNNHFKLIFLRIILTTTEQQLRVRSCSILGIPKGHKVPEFSGENKT